MKYYQALDSGMEETLTEIAELAAQICNVPIALVTLLDDKNQWFKARVGVRALSAPRDIAICAYTILQDDVIIIPDALSDERFASNPLVNTNPFLRFYGGVPLKTNSGLKLGTLCVMDDKPRELSEDQCDSLRALSRQVMNAFDLRLRIRQLDQLNERNLKMLSIVAHDVRSPLTQLSSLIFLMEREKITIEQFDDFTSRLKQSLEGTGVLLENILDWTGAQFKEASFSGQPVSLFALVNQVLDENQYLINEKQNVIALDYTVDALVKTDEKVLLFILRNIIVNALKFTSEGVVTISYTPSSKVHVIKIKDTGVGMSQEKIMNMFDWTKRVNSAGTRGEKGSGLGLRLCKEILAQVNGSLSFESSPKIGTTVSITLPKD